MNALLSLIKEKCTGKPVHWEIFWFNYLVIVAVQLSV